MSFESKMKKKGNDTISQFAKNPYYTGPKKQPFPLWAKISIPSVSVVLTSLAVVLAISVASSSGTEIGLWEKYALNNPNKPFNQLVSDPDASYLSGLKSFASRYFVAESIGHAQLQRAHLATREKTDDIKDINFVCAPFSLHVGLSALYEGAAGETKAQLAQTLGFNGSPFSPNEEIKNAMHSLAVKRVEETETTFFSDASVAMMVDGTTPTKVNDAFLARMTDSYYANVFQGALCSYDMHKLITYYLNEKTNGQIGRAEPMSEEAWRQGFGNPGTGGFWLYLTSCISSRWGRTFMPMKTMDFTNYDGSIAEGASGIWAEFEAEVYEGEDYIALQIPLWEEFHFDVVVPSINANEEDLLSNFSNLLFGFDGPHYRADVHVSLPVFDTASSFVMSEYMANSLGLIGCFDDDGKGSLTEKYPNVLDSGSLNITWMGSTSVSINADGLSAASVTASDGFADSITAPEDPYLPQVDFEANRPFIYSIKNSNGIPLFAGQLAKI